MRRLVHYLASTSEAGVRFCTWIFFWPQSESGVTVGSDLDSVQF